MFINIYIYVYIYIYIIRNLYINIYNTCFAGRGKYTLFVYAGRCIYKYIYIYLYLYIYKYIYIYITLFAGRGM